VILAIRLSEQQEVAYPTKHAIIDTGQQTLVGVRQDRCPHTAVRRELLRAVGCAVADKVEDDRRCPQPAGHHAQRSHYVSSSMVRNFQARNIGAAYPQTARWTP
jgi:hypothetical protein